MFCFTAAAVASLCLTPSSLGVTRRSSSLNAKTLIGTVGPGYTISVKTSKGVRITRLKAGTYVLIVRDRSSLHNFHLMGTPSTDRTTEVPFVGVVRWKISLIKGVTYRYRCDAHPDVMKGTLRAF
jgi:hypothetical protein